MHIPPEQAIEEQLQKLSEAQRATFMSLGDAGLHADKRVSIFQTNAMSLSSRGAGICPTMARLNHGCLGAYNVVYSWQENNEQLGAQMRV